ncbi:MAG: methylenetetrahydrofolate reductase C-terminal domain-containing protein [Candidatus Aenigmarchaeota archaeon]|nr:methylenetetrahydrofolate reductase C-terminal domain-containing protein [Candidatus Aenigmarchaeota archaeon]
MEEILYEASKRCPKNIKNGPCGAVHDGRCEMGGICAWADAYKILERGKSLEGFEKVRGMEKYYSKDKDADKGFLVGSTLSKKYVPRLKDKDAEGDKGVVPFETKFSVTTELDPPHGAKTGKMKNFLSALPNVDGVNIVDNPLGKPLMSGILPALLVRKQGHVPIYQITCRARNIEAIQSDLFSAYASGVRHILVLTGDYVQKGIKPVFETDSTILTKLIKTKLAEGMDFSNAPLDKPLDFWVGVAVNPNATPLEAEIAKFEKKMTSADFAQTQAVFDKKLLRKFAKAISCPEKVLVGVLPVKDYKMANALSKVPGITMPKIFMDKIKKDTGAGMKLAEGLVKEAKKLGFGGVHIMPMMDAGVVKDLLS